MNNRAHKNYNKRPLNQLLKTLPEKISLLSLAILLSLAEYGVTTLDGILEGPRTGIGRAYAKSASGRTFSDIYEMLKQAKRNSLRIILWRLKKKGLIKQEGKRIKLSSRGIIFVKKLEDKAKAKNWDGKWRIVMFDIPEKRRQERLWLTTQLSIAEYKPLQKSVFIGKYPLETELFKEITKRELQSFIRLIVVGEIDDEEILEKL